LRSTKEGYGSVVIGRIPSRLEEFREDPYRRSLEESIGQVIKFPLMRFFDDPVFSAPCEFVHRGSACLSLCEKLGIVRCEELMLEDVEIVGSSLLYLTYMKGSYMFSYRYTVQDSLPSWYE
jgi:hypothetical protein